MLKTRNVGQAFLLAVLLALTASGAMAQSVDEAFDGPPCCRVIPPKRVLTHVLELNDRQLQAVAQLAREIAAAVGPLREELRMLQADLHAELTSGNPDPCVVGELVLAIGKLKVEICRTILSFEDDFLAILNPAQQAKWLEIKDRFCRDQRPRDEG